MEQLFERTVRKGGEVLFYAKDVAESLGYANTGKAVRDHVWEEDKYTLGKLQRGSPEFTLCRGQPNTVLITEQGVYQLIFGSELKRAKEF